MAEEAESARHAQIFDVNADAFRDITQDDVNHLLDIAAERAEIRHLLARLVYKALRIRALGDLQ